MKPLILALLSPSLPQSRQAMNDAPELKPCPFCGGEATISNSVVDPTIPYAYCKDHCCPGWTVSRTHPTVWNNRPNTYTRKEVERVLEAAAFEATVIGLREKRLAVVAALLKAHDAILAIDIDTAAGMVKE